QVRRDPVRSNAEAVTKPPNELEILFVRRIERTGPILGNIAVSCQIAREPAGQICRRFIERWALLKGKGQIEDLDEGLTPRGPKRIRATQREPLEELSILLAVKVHRGKPIEPASVAISDAVCNAERRQIPQKACAVRGKGPRKRVPVPQLSGRAFEAMGSPAP